jgi:phage recombination protein Bet
MPSEIRSNQEDKQVITNQIATIDSNIKKVSLLATMASKYSMEPSAFAATLRATVMPASTTNEQMAAFLVVAHEYGLNPITREIHAFPSKGGITPVVGIDGWINLAQRRSEFDGMEHEYEHDANGNCVSCTCRIYRKDRSRPVVVTEFMAECRRPTEPWKSHPRRLLRHKATIQAIRYAFGFAGIKDEDDAEVIYSSPTVVESRPVADLNARLAASTPEPAPTETIDTATGEVAPLSSFALDLLSVISDAGSIADLDACLEDAAELTDAERADVIAAAEAKRAELIA